MKLKKFACSVSIVLASVVKRASLLYPLFVYLLLLQKPLRITSSEAAKNLITQNLKLYLKEQATDNPNEKGRYAFVSDLDSYFSSL